MRIWIDALARDACAGAGAGLRAVTAPFWGVHNYQHLESATGRRARRQPLDEGSCALLGLGPREVVRPLPLLKSRVFLHLAL